LLAECLDDYIGEDNPVRIVDASVDEIDLETLGFEGTTDAATGPAGLRPLRRERPLGRGPGRR